MSRHSTKSSSNYAESFYWRCLGKGKTSISIRIDDSAPPEFLEDYEDADFRGDYETAVQSLLRAIPIARSEEPIAPRPQQSKGCVFLSYAEEDRDFVEQIINFLRAQAYGYWDYEDSDRDYHTQIFLELETVIMGAAATLSIVSPAWKRSEWAVREFFFSEEAQVPVFLLKARETGPILAIAGRPYVDFTSSEEHGFAKLARELKRKGL